VQGDAQLVLRSLTTKAAIDQEVNEASARDLWEKISDLAKRVNDKRWQARAEAELGIITFLDGDVATATRMLKSALLSALLHGDFGAVITYGAIVGNGQVELGQPETGLTTCNLALKLAAIISDAGFPFMAYEGKARALIALHRESEAKRVLEKAISQAKAQGARAAEAQLLVVAGKQAAANDPKDAIQYLRSATELCENAGFRHVLAWSTLELARVYRDTGDLENAEKFGTESLDAMREVGDRYHLPFHFSALADLKAKGGKAAEADQLYDQAADVVESLLVNVPSRQVQGTLIGVESQLYLNHFRLAATQLRNVTKAYQVLERARGRSIAAALREEPLNTAKADLSIKHARTEVNRIQLALLREANRDQRRELLDELFEEEQILAPVGSPKNHLQKATVQPRPIALTKVQRALRPDEMVLEYILDEPNSFCLSLTRRGAAVTMLRGGRKRIEELTDKYLKEVRSRERAAKTGGTLNSLLVEPIPGAESMLRLIIVPDGKLHLLPFGSLTDRRGLYLLDSHIVTYAPSASVLYLIRNTPITCPPRQAFLGVGDVQYDQTGSMSASKNSGADPPPSTDSGNPFDPIGSPLEPISGARDEVVAASQVFGTKKLLLGRDATEAAFKFQPLSDFVIIHIAAHGIASARFPDRAALILGNDPQSGEDGLLQVREIRDFRLSADLVTLSACDTGVGLLEGEGGIANLVRAFLFAGAKSVVASLWAASDVYTRNLMRHFYGYIAHGEDKGSALRHSQMDLINEFGDQAKPIYWAGFIMVGDGSSGISISPSVITPGFQGISSRCR
jgi:CHAT domain-containing protein